MTFSNINFPSLNINETNNDEYCINYDNLVIYILVE